MSHDMHLTELSYKSARNGRVRPRRTGLYALALTEPLRVSALRVTIPRARTRFGLPERFSSAGTKLVPQPLSGVESSLDDSPVS